MERSGSVRMFSARKSSDVFLLLLNRASLSKSDRESSLRKCVDVALGIGLRPLVVHDLRQEEEEPGSSFSSFADHMNYWKLHLGAQSKPLFDEIACQVRYQQW